MTAGDERDVIKRGRKRSVVRAGVDGNVAIKRFHDPGSLGRWRDRGRATSEHRIWCALFERGLAVPPPVALRHTRAGWEIESRWLAGSVALSDVVGGKAASPSAPAALAPSIGRLLARAHAVGLDHPDLHAGNVLVADESRAWLVDFHRARLRPTLPASVLLRDLVHLCADLRERVPFALRALGLAAYCTELPVALRELLPPTDALLAAVEERARRERRVTLHRARARWTRDSSACRTWTMSGCRAFARADLDERAIEELGRLAEGVPAEPRRGTSQLRSHGDASALVVSSASWSSVRAMWYGAVRLCDHGLACARPLVLAQASTRGDAARSTVWAAFELPHGSERLADVVSRCTAERRHSIAHSLGALAGGLHDRGLDLPRLSIDAWTVDALDRVHAAEVHALAERASDADPLSIAGTSWLQLARSVLRTSTDRTRFATAFVRAQRSGPAGRALVHSALLRSLESAIDG